MLTNTDVKNAKPKKNRNNEVIENRLWDKQHGLYLVVTKTGSKRWCAKYLHDGRTRITGLGNWPKVSLQKARDKAIDLQRAVREGRDPISERRAQKHGKVDSKTFEAAAWLWFEVWRHGKAERHVRQQEQRLRKNILPAIGSRPIEQIEARELVHMAIAIEKRSPELARRSLEVCDAIFRYAVVHSLTPRNTARDIKAGDFLKAKTVRNQPRIDAKDAGALMRAIDTYPVETTRAALLMLHYTFLRASEVAGARFDEFEGLNTKAPIWKIPGERMKADREHWVPCSPQVIEIVSAQRKRHPRSEYLFPGQGKTPTIHPGTLLLALARLGYRGKHSAHGARGLASTVLHEHQFPHDVIELCLAHAPEDKVSAAYNHAKLIETRREIMCWWARYLDSARRGKVTSVRT